MASISVPLEFWFNRNTSLAIPLHNIHFNHPVKSILFSLNINNNSKKYKEEQDINFICDELKKNIYKLNILYILYILYTTSISVPFDFWFNKNSGLSLPMISLNFNKNSGL